VRYQNPEGITGPLKEINRKGAQRRREREREILAAGGKHSCTHSHTLPNEEVCDASGQKIKIVLVADYYCKNAHSTAAKKKKKRKGGGKEAEKGEAAGGKKGAGRRLLFCCFCFALLLLSVFSFSLFSSTLLHTHRGVF